MVVSLPATTRALVLHSYDNHFADLAVEDRPLPQPGKNEVVVKMAYAPVNPSDLMFMQGLYGVKKPLPTVPGFEGSGTVIAAGPGILAKRLLGKRVACAADKDGTWAEYMTTSALQCIPLPANISDEQGAMLVVNPLTAMAFIDIAKQRHAKTIVLDAAASALGRIAVRLARREKLQTIAIVRRDDQAKLVQANGATFVLNSAAPDFANQLRALAKEQRATVAFDAVGGTMTGTLLAALPTGAQIVVYGALERAPIQFNPGDIIFRPRTITGFYLTHWLARKNLLGMLALTRQLRRVSREIQSEVHQRVPLADALAALKTYEANMTAGKLLFQM